MEANLEKLSQLVNLLSMNRVDYYNISGVLNSNGEILCRLNYLHDYNPLISYYGSIESVEFSAMLPNLKKGINDMFYYYLPNSHERHQISFDEGSYDVIDYANIIKEEIAERHKLTVTKDSDHPIRLSLSPNSGKAIIKLKEGWSVDFTAEQTWADVLGFERRLYDQPKNVGTDVVDIVPTQKIFISCPLFTGANVNGSDTNVIFTTPNKFTYGELISIKPHIPQRYLLREKQFESIKIRFFNEDNQPLTFAHSQVTLTLKIEQC